jgi:hypothetical protein
VPLKVIEAPYRDLVRPLMDYIQRLRREKPRAVIAVYIPEYVISRWWQHLLHNQSALRIKTRLFFTGRRCDQRALPPRGGQSGLARRRAATRHR